MTMPIQVWQYRDAPEEFRKLGSESDADWLAVVPPALAGINIGWADSGTLFGVCIVERHELADGSIVLIGYHS
jgi:hypothetical protein